MPLTDLQIPSSALLDHLVAPYTVWLVDLIKMCGLISSLSPQRCAIHPPFFTARSSENFNPEIL